jgi:hypothetical protein
MATYQKIKYSSTIVIDFDVASKANARLNSNYDLTYYDE